MNRYPTIFCCLLMAFALSTTPNLQAQTPAPAVSTAFTLPTADGKNSQAVILPAANNQAYLVYTTPTGQIGWYLMTPMAQPQPPKPEPKPEPTKRKLVIAVVEDTQTTTAQQRAVLSDPKWRKIAQEKHDFRGIIPKDTKEPTTGEPSPAVAPFLKEAGDHPMPWLIVCDSDGTLLWEGSLPTTAAEIEALIKTWGGDS